ncbi:hypothetical protein TNIN_128371 [Trichonephila inaurata madagascariensis]|uniref:Uncharacterized protein n=1 Tax=Trichonephila inaurata madagascariensis TaxID=2747483 RepID=A0A8X6MIH1_9ARAC|nr:hypothetical protein TNIN_128371 [Trichonephila inaurata madagascariensis]
MAAFRIGRSRTRVEYRLLNLVDLKEVLLSAPPNLYDNARLADYWPDELLPKCVWFKNRRAKWRKQQREEQERRRRILDDLSTRHSESNEDPLTQGDDETEFLSARIQEQQRPTD